MNTLIFLKYSYIIFFIIYAYLEILFYTGGFIYVLFIGTEEVFFLLYISLSKYITYIRFYFNIFISFIFKKKSFSKNNNFNDSNFESFLSGNRFLYICKLALKHFKNFLSYKDIFYKQGSKKNYYFNIFFSKKKKFTDFFWNSK